MSMLEPYDAQMLDYPSDIDVPMYSSSSDSWFHAEATMEDANTPLNSLAEKHDLQESSHLSIEVEMDAYTSEYEMADDIQDQSSSAELLDVEVYDASLAHSPTPNLEDGSYSIQESHQVSYDTQNEQTDLSFAHPPVPPPGDIVDTSSEHQLPGGTSQSAFPPEESGRSGATQEDLDHPETQSQKSYEHDEQSLAGSSFIPGSSDVPSIETSAHITEEAGDSTGIEYEQNNGDDGDLSYSRVHVADTVVDPVPHTSSDKASVQDGETVNEQPAIKEDSPTSPVEHRPGQDNSYTETPKLGNAVEDEKPHDEYRAETEQGQVVEERHETAGEVDDREDRTGISEATPAIVSEESTSTGDPHEISEGVYIDPPPPVLLSISGQVEVSLFNELITSGSSSSPAEPENQLQTAHILLQNFPTLYYEPISSVFEALRQDDYITNIAEYADSELVIDAYDLQLVISEDNIFAREVSLHDLNTLHDASGIPGPLRLRMQTIAPRFIVRFHMLQDQAARLHENATIEDGNTFANQEQEVNVPLRAQGETREESSVPHNPSDEEYEHLSGVTEPDTSGNAEGEIALEHGPGSDPLTRLNSEESPKESHESSEGDENEEEDIVDGLDTPVQVPDINNAPEDEGNIAGDDLLELSILPIEASDVTDSNEYGSEIGSTHVDDTEEQPNLDVTDGNADATAVVNNYEDDGWDDEDAEGDLETVSGADDENEADTTSNESSATLSSKASKRSYDEADLEPGDPTESLPFPNSPGKRIRVE